MSEIAEVLNAGMEAAPATRAGEQYQIASSLLGDVMEVLAQIRTSRKSGFFPLSTVQSIKLQVSLEQVGRSANFLADELRREGGRR